jgi:hypothetical protein
LNAESGAEDPERAFWCDSTLRSGADLDAFGGGATGAAMAFSSL